MRLKNLKRRVLCFVLIFCMFTGDWLPTLASELATELGTEQAEETLTETVAEDTAEAPEERTEEEEQPAETPSEDAAEEQPAETPGEEGATEDQPAETPSEDAAEDQPAETPGEEGATEDQPAETPGEDTAEDQPAETPSEDAAEEQPAETPGEEGAAEEQPAETPGDEGVVEDQPVETPSEEITPEETVQETPSEETTPEETVPETPTEETESEEDAEEVIEEELTEEELAAVTDLIEQIELLDSSEKIEETLAQYVAEEDWEGYGAYLQTCVNTYAKLGEKYEALSESQKTAVTNAEKLQELEWLKNLTEETVVSIVDVIEQIEALDSNEKIEETLAQYVAEEDWEGYEAYLYASASAAKTVSESYEALSEAQKKLVVNAAKLQELEWLKDETLLAEMVAEVQKVEYLPDSFFKNFVFSDAAEVTATSATGQSRAVNSTTGIEYTKRIAKNSDGTYTLTLTAKVPEQTTKRDVLIILDISGSMDEKFTDASGNTTTRIDEATDMIMDVQRTLYNDKNARLGLVGFYSWAGLVKKKPEEIDKYPNPVHGYEYPLYVTFDEWEKGRNNQYDWATDGKIIISGYRPVDIAGREKEPAYNAQWETSRVARLEHRSVIPNKEALSSVFEGQDPDNNPGNEYSIFYNTNWEAGYRAAVDMLATIDTDRDSEKTIIFITDGDPSIHMDGELDDGDVAKGSDPSLKTWIKVCAEETTDERTTLNAGDNRIISVLVGEDAAYPEFMGFPTFGSELSTTQLNKLSSNGQLVSTDNKNILLDGTRTDVFDVIKEYIVDDYYTNLTMTDDLSQYVELVDTNALTSITTSYEYEGNTYVLTDREATRIISGDKVSVDFSFLIPGATYSMSFKVKPSQQAYDTYADLLGNDNLTASAKLAKYPHTGAADTGTISAGQKGFYSNDSATLKATLGGTRTYTMTYPKPVIQVELLTIPVRKTWTTSETTKPDVEVALSMTMDGVTKGSYRTTKFEAGDTTTHYFYNVPPGYDSYSVSEVDVPEGYQMSFVTPSTGMYAGTNSSLTSSGFTIRNTQLLDITIEKVWNVHDSLKPSNNKLVIGIGKTVSKSSDFTTVELTPSTDDKNLWTGTVTIPYITSGSYFIKEYWHPGEIDVKTTYQRTMKDGTLGEKYAIYANNATEGTRTALLNYDKVAITDKITFYNTQYIDIEVEKVWNVQDTSLIPATLEVGIGSGESKSTDYKRITLSPNSTGATTWTGTINDVPYHADIESCYIKEYYNNENVITRYRYTYTPSLTTTTTYSVSGFSTSNSTNECRYFTLTPSRLATTKKISFTNAELVDIPVEKIWKIANTSLIPNPNSLSVSIYNSTWGNRTGNLTPSSDGSDLWIGTVKVPYITTETFQIREYWNKSADVTTTMSRTAKDTGTVTDLGTISTNSSLNYRYRSISGTNLFESAKITIENTEYISIALEKNWQVYDSSLYSGYITNGLHVQIDRVVGGKTTYSGVRLKPQTDGSTTWVGTVKVPYDENARYNIFEWWNDSQDVVTTAERTTKAGSDIQMSVAKPSSNDGFRYISTITAEQLKETSKITLTNTEQIRIPVEKQWNVDDVSKLPSKITINLGNMAIDKISTIVLENNGTTNWTGEFVLPYNQEMLYSGTYYVQEVDEESTEKYETKMVINKGTGSSSGNGKYVEFIANGVDVIDNISLTNSQVIVNNLIFKKVVTGYALENMQYDFTVKLGSDTASLSGEVFIAEVYKEGAAGTVLATYTFTPNEVESFKLRHNEYIVIKDVPADTTFQVRETTPDYYTMTAVIEGREGVLEEGDLENGVYAVNADGDTTVVVTNTVKDIGPPLTGSFTDSYSFAMSLAVSVAGLLLYGSLKLYSKKRR